jgi:hypothetical protein
VLLLAGTEANELTHLTMHAQLLRMLSIWKKKSGGADTSVPPREHKLTLIDLHETRAKYSSVLSLPSTVAISDAPQEELIHSF